MALDPANLVWIDLEMTGLDPDSDRIIEIATVVTDADLNLLGQGPVLAIHQPAEVLAGMDDWNQRTHSRTGLIDRVHDSRITAQNAEAMTLGFLSEYVLKRRAETPSARIAGFSIDICPASRPFYTTGIST